jgi:hypothetical protein
LWVPTDARTVKVDADEGAVSVADAVPSSLVATWLWSRKASPKSPDSEKSTSYTPLGSTTAVTCRVSPGTNSSLGSRNVIDGPEESFPAGVAVLGPRVESAATLCAEEHAGAPRSKSARNA